MRNATPTETATTTAVPAVPPETFEGYLRAIYAYPLAFWLLGVALVAAIAAWRRPRA